MYREASIHTCVYNIHRPSHSLCHSNNAVNEQYSSATLENMKDFADTKLLHI